MRKDIVGSLLICNLYNIRIAKKKEINLEYFLLNFVLFLMFFKSDNLLHSKYRLLLDIKLLYSSLITQER